MKIQFCICLKDREYAERVCRYLNHKGEGEIQAVIIGEEDLRETAGRSTIVLTDSASIKEVPYRAVFWGRACDAEAIHWTKERIEPYLTGARLYRECMSTAERLIRLDALMEESTAEVRREPVPLRTAQAGPQKGAVACVYSPSGGIGKTTVSLAVCDMISHFDHQKVLYLNLEGICDWRKYYQSKALYNLSDLLYTMLLEADHPETAKEQLEEIVSAQANGVFFVEPCNDPGDLSVLDEAEVQKLFDLLRESFDWIICDLNPSFEGITRRVFRLSDYRILLHSGDERSREKQEDLRRLLMRQHCLSWIEEQVLFLKLEPLGSRVRKRDSPRTLVYEKDLFREKDGLLVFNRSTEWYEKLRRILKEAGLVHGG